MALSFTGAASSDRYEIATADYTNLSSNVWTLGIMIYCDSTAADEYTVFTTEAGTGGIRITYDPDDAGPWPIHVRVEDSSGFASAQFLGSSDFDDRWGMLIIERTAATDFNIYRARVADSDTVSNTNWTPSVTATNWAGLDLYIGNDESASQEFDGYIAEAWLIEGDTLTTTEMDNIANGDNFINDYVSDANIRFWFSLEDGDDPEVDFIHDIEADRIGTVATTTHPITAYTEPTAGDIAGLVPSLTGGFTATYTFSTAGDVDGTLPSLTGAFTALFDQGTLILGTFPAMGGLFSAYSAAHLLREGVTCSSTLSVDSFGKLILENITAIDSTSLLFTGTATLLESIHSAARMVLVQMAQTTEAIEATEALTAAAAFRASIVEVLELVEALVGGRTSSVSLSEALDIASSFAVAYRMALLEALTAASAQTSQTSLGSILTEALDLSANSTIFRALATVVTETLGAAAAQSVLQEISAALSEQVAVEFYFELLDEIYLATVLNTETDALWKYHNYGFNSFNEQLAAKEDGIYLLHSGTDDEGDDIDAEYETGYDDFGTPNLKRFPSGGLYLRLANDGTVQIKVTSSRQGTVEDDWYEETHTLDAYDTARITTHDGLTSRYWKFQVSNDSGSELNLDAFQMYPITLSRRIR